MQLAIRFVKDHDAYIAGHITLLPTDEARQLIAEGKAVRFLPTRRSVMDSLVKKADA